MFVEYVSVGVGLTSSPSHNHNNFELILNLKGSGTMTIENKDYAFKPGTVIICPPGASHIKYSTSGFKDIYMRFDDVSLNSVVLTYDDYEDNTVKMLLYQALRYYNKKEVGYKEILNSIAKLIITIITFEQRKTKGLPIVKTIKNRIIENFYNTDFKFEKIYDTIPYNADYIRRCFKKEMNITPVQYLTKLRIDNAVKLMDQDLFSGKKPIICDIAFLCGYEDTLYFSKVFRQQKGLSPTEYIKNYKKNLKEKANE